MPIPVIQVVRILPAQALISMGCGLLTQANNLLVEDSKFSFYDDSTIEGSFGNVILRGT